MTSYSYLSATSGSTFVARRAGIKQANNATTIKTSGNAKGHQIRGRYSNKRLLIKRVTLLLQQPDRYTYQRQFHPWPIIKRRMCRGVAPSARRIPISLVRCETK